MIRTFAFLIVTLIAFSGCGKKHSQEEIDRGQKAVVAVLDNWKSNEPVANLKSLPEPIEFPEELRATNKLLDYTIERVDASDPQNIRYFVMLKLQDRKGKTTEREVAYAVALRNPIAVARDPYY